MNENQTQYGKSGSITNGSGNEEDGKKTDQKNLEKTFLN